MVHATQQCEHPAILLWTRADLRTQTADSDRPSTGTCPRPKTEDQDRRPQGFTPRPAKTQDRAGSVWPRPKTTGLHLPKTEDRRPRSGADEGSQAGNGRDQGHVTGREGRGVGAWVGVSGTQSICTKSHDQSPTRLFGVGFFVVSLVSLVSGV